MRVAFAFIAFFGLVAMARAADNPACAKYDNAFAYNACLARLGPKAYFGAPAVGPHGDTGNEGAFSFGHARHGRKHAVFSLGK